MLGRTVNSRAGLRVRRLRFTRFKAKHAWLFLLFPLLWLSTRVETRKRVAEGRHKQGEEDLLRWMTHPAMLGE